MTPRLWITADTHFRHAKPTSPMLVACGRPPNYEDIICREWKRLVAPEDTIIHLGDVIFAHASELGSILKPLPATKILVRGNHDRHHGHHWWMEHGFSFVCDQLVLDVNGVGVILTHEPLAELPWGAELNVHGHLHNNMHREGEVPKQSWHRLLALENTRYRPVLLEEFIK